MSQEIFFLRKVSIRKESGSQQSPRIQADRKPLRNSQNGHVDSSYSRIRSIVVFIQTVDGAPIRQNHGDIARNQCHDDVKFPSFFEARTLGGPRRISNEARCGLLFGCQKGHVQIDIPRRLRLRSGGDRPGRLHGIDAQSSFGTPTPPSPDHTDNSEQQSNSDSPNIVFTQIRIAFMFWILGDDGITQVKDVSRDDATCEK
mmetsp:Transcript_66108/g.182562  ORF Transcript_66108/g.182562 Transcript_66108/m.182562 type:complete len:201 (+) Transcript_66108:13-615(+)